MDWAALRAEFPLLEQRAYFASHSIGPPPRGLFRDLDEYRQTLQLGRRAFAEWFARLGETTRLLERLLGASPGSVALRENSTTAQMAVASALAARPTKNRVVITSLDFPSSRYLWNAQRARGFLLCEVGSVHDVEIAAEQVVAAIDARTAIVAVAIISWKSGALLDIEPVVAAAHAVGAVVILDAFQAIGIVPLDVQKSGVDVVVGGTNKWLSGGAGLGFLYVRPELAEVLEPAYPGWFAHAEPTAFAAEFTPARGAWRFAQGPPPIEPVYSARAGLVVANDVGVENIRPRQLALTTCLLERAEERRLRVRTPRRPAARGGFVSFDVPHAERIAQELQTAGIDVDCRPGAGLRVAPHYCQTEEECVRVVDAIAERAEQSSLAEKS